MRMVGFGDTGGHTATMYPSSLKRIQTNNATIFYSSGLNDINIHIIILALAHSKIIHPTTPNSQSLHATLVLGILQL